MIFRWGARVMRVLSLLHRGPEREALAQFSSELARLGRVDVKRRARPVRTHP